MNERQKTRKKNIASKRIFSVHILEPLKGASLDCEESQSHLGLTGWKLTFCHSAFHTMHDLIGGSVTTMLLHLMQAQRMHARLVQPSELC